MTEAGFRTQFVQVFDRNFHRLFRYFDRLAGDPDHAADLVQEAFVRLYRRGSLPHSPEAWLISVGMNLFRNARTTKARRSRLLGRGRAEAGHADPSPAPSAALEADAVRRNVRAALEHLSDRDRSMLLLRAEGYSYREIADALELNEASVGTLLSRVRQAFRDTYREIE